MTFDRPDWTGFISWRKEYWPSTPDSFRISATLAPLYLRHLHSLSYSLLCLFEREVPSQRDVQIIGLLLETRLIVEADIIQEEAAIEVKVNIAKVALHTLCVKDIAENESAKSYVIEWYKQGGQWKYVLEKAVQQIVS